MSLEKKKEKMSLKEAGDFVGFYFGPGKITACEPVEGKEHYIRLTLDGVPEGDDNTQEMHFDLAVQLVTKEAYDQGFTLGELKVSRMVDVLITMLASEPYSFTHGEVIRFGQFISNLEHNRFNEAVRKVFGVKNEHDVSAIEIENILKAPVETFNRNVSTEQEVVAESVDKK